MIFQKLVAFFLILILSPIFLIVAIIVFVEDGYPIFFKQKRVGVNYSFFNIYKFRTMKKNTPNIATHLLENPQQYFLIVGGVLRKISFDELPNLINVLKGDMAFVGPRPALYNQNDLMALRVTVGVDKLKPGITGWAQINGRDELSIESKVAFDREYLARKSFWFDLKIALMTFAAIISSRGIRH